LVISLQLGIGFNSPSCHHWLKGVGLFYLALLYALVDEALVGESRMAEEAGVIG